MTIEHGLELRSRVTAAGELELSLVDVPVPRPGPDQVVVRIEAAPINPTDLALLLGPADLTTLRRLGTSVIATIPEARRPLVAARVDQSLAVGTEGAGIIVEAGANASALLGATVAVLGSGMYAQYRVMRAADCTVLPAGATPAQGASSFVNPMTTLGMVGTMRREGHTALVHTAAASNLGQMLVRVCAKDGIGLVNIVRSDEQVRLLRELGAEHVCNSTAVSFGDDLTAALAATNATLVFDAIAGGPLASQILTAMETVAMRSKPYNRYGSPVHKQVYFYGVLDPRPTELTRNYGFAWGVGGWLLTPFLIKAGGPEVVRLRARVMAELTTTFASHYSAEISLAEMLAPELITAYSKRATGAKYLVNPARS